MKSERSYTKNSWYYFGDNIRAADEQYKETLIVFLVQVHHILWPIKYFFYKLLISFVIFVNFKQALSVKIV